MNELKEDLATARAGVDLDRTPYSLLVLAQAYTELGRHFQDAKDEENALKNYQEALKACNEAILIPKADDSDTPGLKDELRDQREEVRQLSAQLGKSAEIALAEKRRWVRFTNRVSPLLGQKPLTEADQPDDWITQAEDRIGQFTANLKTAQEAVEAARMEIAKARETARKAVDEAGKETAAARTEAQTARSVADRLRFGEEQWAAAGLKFAVLVGYSETLPDHAKRWTTTPDRESRDWIEGLVKAVSYALNPGEVLDSEEELASLVDYGAGLVYYYQQRYEPAIEKFTQAIRHDPNDARYFYYRGLARYGSYSTGGPASLDAAVKDMKQGYALEHKGLPSSVEVGRALSRIQFDVRNWAESFRNPGRVPADAHPPRPVVVPYSILSPVDPRCVLPAH